MSSPIRPASPFPAPVTQRPPDSATPDATTSGGRGAPPTRAGPPSGTPNGPPHGPARATSRAVRVPRDSYDAADEATRLTVRLRAALLGEGESEAPALRAGAAWAAPVPPTTSSADLVIPPGLLADAAAHMLAAPPPRAAGGGWSVVLVAALAATAPWLVPGRSAVVWALRAAGLAAVVLLARRALRAGA